MMNCFSAIVAPIRRSTFGWLRLLHVMTSLQNLCGGGSQCVGKHAGYRGTNLSDLVEVSLFAYPQSLRCNLLTKVFSLPYICKSTMCMRSARRFVAKWNLQ